MKEKNSGKIIIFSVIFLVVGLIVGYILGVYVIHPSQNFNRNPGNFAGQFQINQSSISEVTNVFSNAKSLSDVESYCSVAGSQNMMNCFYYCRNVEPTNQYCSSIMNSTRGGYFRNGQ